MSEIKGTEGLKDPLKADIQTVHDPDQRKKYQGSGNRDKDEYTGKDIFMRKELKSG